MAHKEKPIAFTTAMVASILTGQKTMTRRLINPQPREYAAGDGLPEVLAWAHPGAANPRSKSAGMYFDTFDLTDQEFSEKLAEQCPYQPGDKLWVREEHYVLGAWVKNGTTKTGKQKWKFVEAGPEYDAKVLYSDNAPSNYRISMFKTDPSLILWHKRNPRFMPKKYARTWLEVESVEAQQIQSISEEDAQKEGVEENQWLDIHTENMRIAYLNYLPEGYRSFMTAKDSFESLWASIHGTDSWNNNDWVFAISFKRI